MIIDGLELLAYSFSSPSPTFSGYVGFYHCSARHIQFAIKNWEIISYELPAPAVSSPMHRSRSSSAPRPRSGLSPSTKGKAVNRVYSPSVSATELLARVSVQPADHPNSSVRLSVQKTLPRLSLRDLVDKLPQHDPKIVGLVVHSIVQRDLSVTFDSIASATVRCFLSISVCYDNCD